MLKDDDLLRRLPNSLDLRQRLELDAMVTAHDLACLAYGNLANAAWEMHRREERDTSWLRTVSLHVAFNAWSFVDNLHTFRTFARRLERREGGKLDRLISATQVYTDLRNKMDHRANNLGNSAQQKSPILPIYGVFSFISPRLENMRWNVHHLTLGAMQHAKHVFPAVDASSRPHDHLISNLTLDAFELSAPLSATYFQWEDAMLSMSKNFGEALEPELLRVAELSNMTIEAVKADHAGGSMWISFQVGEAEEDAVISPQAPNPL